MQTNNQPLGYLCHYYENSIGPFRSLTDLSEIEGEALQQNICKAGNIFASQRSPDYLSIRRSLEKHIRDLFTAKGGCPIRTHPHYMILGECDWLKQWYIDGKVLKIPIEHFSPLQVSFTYGDSFPAMRFQDGRVYRSQVYTLAELPGLVAEFGLPQVWNPDGKFGPDRYIEAQVWDDKPITNTMLKNPGS